MPHVQALIARARDDVLRTLVSDSLCVPSRTTMFRGQYAHNTGVWTNGGDNGGFETAHANGVEQDTVATRLHDAGYRPGCSASTSTATRTALRTERRTSGLGRVGQPGLGNPYTEYGYVLNQNRRTACTTTARGLRDRRLRRACHRLHPPRRPRARAVLRLPRRVRAPPARDTRRRATADVPPRAAPRTPSYDEADVSHKPRYVRDLPLLDAAPRLATIDGVYRRRMQSLQAVDRGVARLRAHAPRNRRARQHVHRVHVRQRLPPRPAPACRRASRRPYETDIHVPLLVRGPGVRAGAHVTATRRQHRPRADVRGAWPARAPRRSPTAARCSRSCAAIGRRTGAPPSSWSTGSRPARPNRRVPCPRRARPSSLPTPTRPGPTASPRIARSATPCCSTAAPIPDYDGVRTARYVFVEYGTGERELYDLRHDPDEVHNLAGTLPGPGTAAGTPDRASAVWRRLRAQAATPACVRAADRAGGCRRSRRRR